MLTRSFRTPLALCLALLVLVLSPPPAQGQNGAPIASVADLQLEIRKLRKRADSLRGELKRQQKAVGTVRQELTAQRQRAEEQAVESGRLRDQTAALQRWLLLFGAISVAGVGLGLWRRNEPVGPPAPLALARERTGRLHEGLSALEARIQLIEQRSPEG